MTKATYKKNNEGLFNFDSIRFKAHSEKNCKPFFGRNMLKNSKVKLFYNPK